MIWRVNLRCLSGCQVICLKATFGTALLLSGMATKNVLLPVKLQRHHKSDDVV